MHRLELPAANKTRTAILKTTLIVFFILFLSATSATPAPASFTEFDPGLTNAYNGSVVWGDYDNDGDLDILLVGYITAVSYTSKVYRNDGGGTFTDINAGLTNVGSAGAWGDYDNDGDLDIIVAGNSGGSDRSSLVYRNDGGDTFTDINAGLPGTSSGSAAWGDYDNDGDLDILLVGCTGISPITAIAGVYRNDGNDTFTDINAGLKGVETTSSVWGDYDNDGDLDILLTGTINSTSYSLIYRNDGSDTFTNINAGLIGNYFGNAAWGDYDNDGDLDVLLTGTSGSDYQTVIYRNDGNDTFTNINAGLTGLMKSSAAWGDYDNDGDLDILVIGQKNASDNVSIIYRNDGSDTFTDINAGLTGFRLPCAAWGDYDNDGDLDIILTGYNGASITRIYRNDGGGVDFDFNTPPNAPAGLIGVQDGASNYKLSWQAPSSDAATTDGTTAGAIPAVATPSEGLYYNIYVGTSSGAFDFASPMADLTNGYRRVAAIGPWQGTAMVTHLAADTLYYWSVQAVDTSLAGGPFAQEGCFRLDNQVPTISDVTKTGEAELTFTEDDFLNVFSDAEGDAMSLVRITTLPDTGQLMLNREVVSANDEIVVSDLGALTYQAPSGEGQTSFTWQARDCTDWSAGAQMILNYSGDDEGGGDGGPLTGRAGGGCFLDSTVWGNH